MVDFAEYEAFRSRVEDLFVAPGDGSMQVDPDKLAALARENSELYILVCRSYVHLAEQRGPKWHGTAQAALALATVFSAVYEDDGLQIVIEDQLAAGGLEVRAPTVAAVDADPDTPPPRPVRVIQVDAQTLTDQNIYMFIKVFSHTGIADEESLAGLRALRGECIVTFPVPLADPREVWEVPEVRAYVAKLNTSLPYLPYFLAPHDDQAALGMWWRCLAPAHAMSAEGLDAMDGEVFSQIAYTVRVTGLFAGLLGEDPELIRAELMQGFPPEFVELVRVALDELDAE